MGRLALCLVGLSACGGEAPSTGGGTRKGGTGLLEITSALTLDRGTVRAGETLHGTVTYRNPGTQPFLMSRLGIGGRPPGANNAAGPFDDLAPVRDQVTLPAGGSVTLTAERAFSAADPSGQWYAFATFRDAGGIWFDGPPVFFTVIAGPGVDGGVPSDGGGPGDGGAPGDGGGGPSLTGLHVAGNQLLNGSGQAVHLHGVNHSGTEYACVQGFGVFEGPNDAAAVQAMLAWKANAVRVPLNEDCWLAINGVNAMYAGAAYQQVISDWVRLLNANGMAAILELHWSAPGTQLATGQLAMPDRDHAPAFWTEVANAYKNASAVILEPFNEPFPDSNQGTAAAWTCWKDGGTCPGISYQAAGMQELVTAIRSTGATNVILLGGVQYSNDLSGWLAHRPTDPTGNLAAAWHIYDFNTCNDPTCYDGIVAGVAAQVPIVATEIGSQNCNMTYLDTLMGWLERHGDGYLAWTWNTWGTGCGSIALISDYNGTATTYGQLYKSHLLATF